VWIYSDHGQEPVRGYTREYGEDVADAIHRAWDAFTAPTGGAPHPPAAAARAEAAPAAPPGRDEERTARSRHIASELPHWFAPTLPPESAAPPVPEGELTVVHRGPIGFVYLPEGTDDARRDAFAERVARDAHVPHVLVRDRDGGARVWSDRGEALRLPGDEARIFGPDHPHAERLTADTLRLVHHEHAGDLVLWSWRPGGALSFKSENGAHGGPGPRETTAFVVMPAEAASHVPAGRTLRPSDLRSLVQRVLDPELRHLPAGASRRAVPAGGRHVRLMTYNVHGCRGMDGRYSVERIARVIAREKPHVVCLQELDQERQRSGHVDQAHEIASRLESGYHFHSVREADDGRFGDAVLSRLPLRVLRAGPLPALETRLELEPRGVLWVEVDADGETIQVMNTHLSIAERERRLQVEALVGQEWLGHPDCRGPVVLAGDLNATSTSYTGRRLSGVLRDAVLADPRRRRLGERRPRTWSGRMPILRIDHVFTSAHFRVVGLDVPRTRLTRTASDHLPLVVDLEWRPGEAEDREAAEATAGTAARTP